MRVAEPGLAQNVLSLSPVDQGPLAVTHLHW